MSKQQGYAFEKEISEGLSKYMIYYFKIPDTRMLTRCPRCFFPFKLMFHKPPSDYIAVRNNGKIVFIEAKSCAMNRFPYENIKPHQLEYGAKIEEATSKDNNFGYWFIIYMHKFKKVYALRPSDIMVLKQEYECSIPIEGFQKYAIELERKTAKYNDGKCAFVVIDKL